MVAISPILLAGPWKEGFALDVHTMSSQYVGDDAYGHPQFATVRSPVGELLYRLKYQSDRSVVAELCETAVAFVKSREWDPTLVIPVPPSRPGRRFQPVPLLAKGTAGLLECPVCENCVVKSKETPELKSVYDYEERLKHLADAYTVDTAAIKDQRVLLIDDLYRSGATIEAVTKALLSTGMAGSVVALTITRTRSNR